MTNDHKRTALHLASKVCVVMSSVTLHNTVVRIDDTSKQLSICTSDSTAEETDQKHKIICNATLYSI